MPISNLSPLALRSLVACKRYVFYIVKDVENDLEYRVTFNFKARLFKMDCIVKGLTTSPELIHQSRSPEKLLEEIEKFPNMLASEYIPSDQVSSFNNGFIPISNEVIDNLFMGSGNGHLVLHKPMDIVDNIKHALHFQYPMFIIAHPENFHKVNIFDAPNDKVRKLKIVDIIEKYNYSLLLMYANAYPASFAKRLPELNGNPYMFNSLEARSYIEGMTR